MRRKHLGPAVLAAVALASPVAAGPLFDKTLGSCGTINCSSVLLSGSIIGHASNNAVAWIEQIYVEKGECLRLQVTAQVLDLEITVVAPNGLVYRDDNGGPSTLPLVKVNNAPVSGYYGVAISTTDGGAGGHDFDLRFGRYVSGNANCLPPTPKF